MPGLYSDPDTGQLISTHSALKTFRRCPKQAQFKYIDRLKPKILGKPLSKGNWMHILLQHYHMGEDWLTIHRKLSAQFADMLDEEQDYYGDLPNECLTLMLAYIWYYKNDPWKVLETEFIIETEFPDGSLYRGRVDALIENRLGLWLVDHKNMGRAPGLAFRLLDGQSGLYMWACLRNRIPVEGFIWNYLITKPIPVPQIVGLTGKNPKPRISTRKINAEYTTYVRQIKAYKKEYGLKITSEIAAEAARLRTLRYDPENPQQNSQYFFRVPLEKNNDLLRRVALENYTTSKRMHSYDFSNQEAVERTVDRSCEFQCQYHQLCALDLLGANTTPFKKQNFRVGDPLDYYNDDRMPERGE